MSILYITITTNDITLTEYSEYNGNFFQVTKNISDYIRPNCKGTLSYEKMFLFHYINSENINYICMTDVDFPIEVAMHCLEEMRSTVLIQIGLECLQSKKFNSNDLNEIIKSKTRFYSQDESFISQIRKDISNSNANHSNHIDKDRLSLRASLIGPLLEDQSSLEITDFELNHMNNTRKARLLSDLEKNYSFLDKRVLLN